MSCWLLTLLVWINLVSCCFKSTGLNLMSLNCFALAGSSGSNRPFAHCCQIFTERKFLVAFSLFQKSNGIFPTSFVAFSLGYKYSITKIFCFVKSFIKALYFNYLTCQILATLLLKHIFWILSSTTCTFQTAYLLPWYYILNV